MACDNGHAGVAALLIEKGADVHSTDKDGSTPLHKACYRGHTAIASLLIENGADVNRGADKGVTPCIGHVVRVILP
jgi:ankyrin repeat protein